MPNLEEAILAATEKQPAEKNSEGLHGSNGAGRPPSPTQASERSANGLEIEHSQDGAPQKVMAQKAALALGNDAHNSQDLF